MRAGILKDVSMNIVLEAPGLARSVAKTIWITKDACASWHTEGCVNEYCSRGPWTGAFSRLDNLDIQGRVCELAH